MKRLVLLIIPALICGAAFTSCENAEQNELEATGGLYVIGGKSEAVLTGSNSNLVFTGNDIISFNVTTGEIVFANRKVDEIISRISLYSDLRFLIGDKPVFVPSITTMCLGDRYCGSPPPWSSLNDLGLVIFNSKTCFLMEGYQSWYFVEKNYEKRKKELEVLIEYLSKKGKIVE
jgi:hypothetical protein